MYYVVLVLYFSVLGSSLPIRVFTCILSVFQPNTTTLSRPKSVQGRAFKYMDDTRVLILYLFVFVCIRAYLLCIGRHLSGFVLYNVLYCITLYLHCIEIEYTLVESTGILLSHARGIQFVLTCICVY